eukprot:TRINITY_DN68104_c1_g1_i2.p1 TRINITY_DN68104_c1_g1~~TRINITY_DN68104_c1_g1_i2.p1  ORF type:complete len:102 (+),score=4.66 TRINITY_DN68104_c1_g1_i2:188-493(+)
MTDRAYKKFHLNVEFCSSLLKVPLSLPDEHIICGQVSTIQCCVSLTKAGINHTVLPQGYRASHLIDLSRVVSLSKGYFHPHLEFVKCDNQTLCPNSGQCAD